MVIPRIVIRHRKGCIIVGIVLIVAAFIFGRFLSAQIFARARSDSTFLHVNAASKNTGIVHLLLMLGADPDAISRSGCTPLLSAVGNGVTARDEVQTVEIVNILSQYGADLNATDAFGRTALHRAIGRGQLLVAQALLDCGAEVNRADEDGALPLHYATDAGSVELVSLLLKYGAKVNATTQRPVLLSTKNSSKEMPAGCTALHFAAYRQYQHVAQRLIRAGADIDAKNNSGKTPRALGVTTQIDTVEHSQIKAE